MKILQVTNFFKPSWESGGPARACYETSLKLIERGHDVTVFTTDGFSRRLDVKTNVPVDVDGITTYYFRNLSNYLSREYLLTTPYFLPFIAFKKLKEFDVVHIHEYRTSLSIITAYFAQKYQIPYVLQARGSLPRIAQKQVPKVLFDRIWGYRILQNASKLIALTNYEFDQYMAMNVDKSKIEIIPNGIDIVKYENLPTKHIFRKKFHISPHQKIILFLGRIHKIKGIDLLLDAYEEVSKKIDDTILVIAGPDEGHLSNLINRIQKNSHQEKILFTGPLYESDKLEAFIDSNVYVLPSSYETFPHTVLEAWACGVPVVATNVCGIADVIGNAGIMVDNTNTLAEAILSVLSNNDDANRYISLGKKRIFETMNLEKTIDKIEAVYTSIGLNT